MATNLIEIFLLMENDKPVSAYADKAQADEDCWVCNDAEKFSPDPHPFWVKPVPVGSPFEI
jgi:hypothetical protein